jgi:hypothetical protein
VQVAVGVTAIATIFHASVKRNIKVVSKVAQTQFSLLSAKFLGSFAVGPF